MIGRLQDGDRYTRILVYTKQGKVISYETLLLTDKDLERFRLRASKNVELEVSRPKPIYQVIIAWLKSWIRRRADGQK